MVINQPCKIDNLPTTPMPKDIKSSLKFMVDLESTWALMKRRSWGSHVAGSIMKRSCYQLYWKIVTNMKQLPFCKTMHPASKFNSSGKPKSLF